MTLFIIAGLGLVFGSFVNALVWRIHKQASGKQRTTINKRPVDLSITKGRSVCVKCGHELGFLDLIPLFSWLFLRGKCRYCRKKIDDSPLVEVGLAGLFILSYIAWLVDINGVSEWFNFGFWLSLVVGMWALFIYDLKWLLLPNRIVFPLLAVAATWRLYSIGFLEADAAFVVRESLLGLLVGGGIFYAIFQISKGRWIGGGDVKLGYVMGLALGPAYVAVGHLVAFYSAAILILPLMLAKRVTRKSKIPFGPFLIAGFVIAGLLGPDIIELYKDLSGLN